MAKTIDRSFADAVDSTGPQPVGWLQRISTDRLLAVLLIGIQLFVLADLSGARLFPIVLACLAVWGGATRVRIQVGPWGMKMAYAILVIGFLLHNLVSPYPLSPDSEFIKSSLAHSLARLLITVQVVQFYLFHESGRLPSWVAFCAAVALAFSMDVSVPGIAHQRMLGIVAVFMALFAMYGSRSRKPVNTSSERRWPRSVLMSLALLAALGLGTAAAWGMRHHERNIESFLAKHIGHGGRSARVGFTPSGRLQSVTRWKADGGDRVRLRIFADTAPEYLRGKVFDTYRGASRATSYTAWMSTGHSSAPLRETVAGRNRPQVRASDRLYDLSPAQPAEPLILDIWPEEGTAARIFAPLGATRLEITRKDVVVDDHGVVTLAEGEDAPPYVVVTAKSGTLMTSRSGSPLPAEFRARLTSLDAEVNDDVRELASRLFSDCRTTRQKLDAVRQHFLDNYTYRFGIDVPHQMDPVTYFLTKRPPAHCEYFATGTAVLLRLADVPCRYVVGYVSRERNSLGGFWVARNKDAHAWVEAYDEQEQRWVTVESTPAAGVPQPRVPSLASQISVSIHHWLSMLRTRIREYGFLGTILSIVQLMWSIPGLVFLLGLFAALTVRYRPRGYSLRFRDRPPARLKGIYAALALLDRRTRENGFVRSPEETLSHFAKRLRVSPTDPAWKSATADCYLLYVELRYQGQIEQEAVRQLRQAVDTLPRATDGRQTRGKVLGPQS